MLGVVMIDWMLTQKQWYKHKDDVIIMTWTPCLCILAYKKKSSGALLASYMFFIE
jgi:hypothetical protein